MPDRALAFEPAEFRRRLLAWYRRSARRLPWREAPSLYKTVVSELMLQQTQVKTVLPYFARWLERFPDFAALAAAPAADVLQAWEGLGYYSRARNLHRLAQAVAALPAPPRSPAEWRELPGIGPYTAAAVTSIAFGHPAACVDGNVVRILAPSAAKAFQPLADRVIAGEKNPGDFNQAMMELGATLCTKHQPQCLLCPVRESCAGAAKGNPDAYPKLAPKLFEKREVVRIWCVSGGDLLLHRAAAASKRLAGIHELPTAEQAGLSADAARQGKLLATKTRGITRFRILESIHEAEAPTKVEESGQGDLVWVPLARLASVTLSGPHRRWVGELTSRASGAPRGGRASA